MIIYKYKINNKERELHVSDNGPAIMQCNTEEYEAYSQDGYDDETITAIFTNQVKKLEEELRKEGFTL